MLDIDYTYEYREELGYHTYRRFFTSYPEFYSEGDSLEEANDIFKARVRDIAIFALNRKWAKVVVSVSVESE